MAEKEKYEKIEMVELTSFKALQIEGPEYQMNLDEDAWSYGAPPPKGCYEFKWFLAKGGLKMGHTKKDDPSTMFTQVDLEGHLVNGGEWDDAVAYSYLKSTIS